MPYDITYMRNLKSNVNKLLHELDSQAYRTDLWLPSVWRGWWERSELGV